MKKYMRSLAGILTGIILSTALSVSGLASFYDQETDTLDGKLLFPGDSMRTETNVWVAPDMTSCELYDNTWTNTDTERAYRVSLYENPEMGESGLVVRPEGYVVTVIGGVSSSDDGITGTHSADIYPEEPSSEGGDSQPVLTKDVASYPDSSWVHIKATGAGEGWHFGHWEFEPQIYLEDIASEELSFLMPAHGLKIKAVYAEGGTSSGEEVSEDASAENQDGAVPEVYTDEDEAPMGEDLPEAEIYEGEYAVPEAEEYAAEGGYPEAEEYAAEESPEEEGGIQTFSVVVENGSGSGSYEVGDQVMILADAGQAGSFQYWTTEYDTVWFENETDPETAFYMPAENVVVTAVYDGETALEQTVEEMPPEAAGLEQTVEEMSPEAAAPEQNADEIPVEAAGLEQTVEEMSLEAAAPEQYVEEISVEEAVQEKSAAEIPQEAAAPEQDAEEAAVEPAVQIQEEAAVEPAVQIQEEAAVEPAAQIQEAAAPEQNAEAADVPASADTADAVDEAPEEEDSEDDEADGEEEDTYFIYVETGGILVNGEEIRDETEAEEGEVVTLSAAGLKDAEIEEWVITNEETGEIISYESEDEENVLFVMPAAEVSVNVRYSQILKNTVEVSGGSGSGTYADGDKVIIEASPAPEGQQFKMWMITAGDITLDDVFSSKTGFTMGEESVSVQAVYEPIPYTLTVNSGSGGGTYHKGDVVNISADWPADGKEFSSWHSDQVTVDSADRYYASLVMPAADTTVSASYQDGPSAAYNRIDGLTQGGEYLKDTKLTFTAVGNGPDKPNPNPGDFKWVPASYQIGTVSGGWSGLDFSTSMSISSAGQYTLTVVFVKQIFDGNTWTITSQTDQKSVTFYVVNALAVQTGDTTPILPFAVAAVAALAVIAGILIYRKKR